MFHGFEANKIDHQSFVNWSIKNPAAENGSVPFTVPRVYVDSQDTLDYKTIDQ